MAACDDKAEEIAFARRDGFWAASSWLLSGGGIVLYTLSIPIIDYRVFLNLDTHRLDVAQFPRNWNDNSFLRGFGRFGVRVSPSSEIPFSEKKYANANNGLRVISLRKDKRYRSDAVPSSVFRRIFFDTYCARFDIGLKNISKEARQREGTFSFRDITSTIASFVEASIYSPSFSKQGNVPFRKIGEYLLAEYLYATTIKPRENLSNDSKNWMAVGCPVIVVEALKDDFLYIYAPEIYRFKRFVGIPEEWGIELFYQTITRNNIPIYVLMRNKNAQKEKVRALRINILKYHQERETLNAVMKLVAREDRYLSHINVQALGKYLDNVTSLYSRKTRDGIQQSTVFEIIRAVESQINNDEYSIMLRLLLNDERLSFLRKRFPKTIEKLYSLPPNVMMGAAADNNTAITNDESTVVEINSNVDERRSAMNKKVFISHSTIDKEFANRLVLFLKAIGIPEKQIICTSRYGNGVPLNKVSVK